MLDNGQRRRHMKHLTRVSVAKADDDFTIDVSAILELIFAFIIDLLGLTGKGDTPTA